MRDNYPVYFHFTCPPKWWRKLYGSRRARAAERRLELAARRDPESPALERDVPNAWTEPGVMAFW